MEANHPKAADYAWSAANDANRNGEELKQRVNELERNLVALANALNDLAQKVEILRLFP